MHEDPDDPSAESLEDCAHKCEEFLERTRSLLPLLRPPPGVATGFRDENREVDTALMNASYDQLIKAFDGWHGLLLPFYVAPAWMPFFLVMYIGRISGEIRNEIAFNDHWRYWTDFILDLDRCLENPPELSLRRFDSKKVAREFSLLITDWIEFLTLRDGIVQYNQKEKDRIRATLPGWQILERK